jgi:hypothetical protein
MVSSRSPDVAMKRCACSAVFSLQATRDEASPLRPSLWPIPSIVRIPQEDVSEERERKGSSSLQAAHLPATGRRHHLCGASTRPSSRATDSRPISTVPVIPREGVYLESGKEPSRQDEQVQ